MANILVGDLRRILKCSIFLKENWFLLLVEELDLPSRTVLHECIKKFVNIEFEYRHLHGDFTIAHVGHYPDLVSIAAHVIVDGFDQSMKFLSMSQMYSIYAIHAKSTFHPTYR